LPYPVTSHSQESQILDGKKLKQRATRSSHPLSPKHSKMKEHSTYKTNSWLKIQPPPPLYRPSGKDRSTPTLGVATQALTGAFWSTHDVLHRTVTHPSGLRVLPTQAPRSCRVSPSSKFLGAHKSRLRPPSLRSWFCGSTK
jgi:hypothetical protein